MPFNREQQEQIIQAVIASKKGGGQSKGGMFRQLGRKFGPFGELIGMVADVLSGGEKPRQREIEDAVRILTEEGFNVTPGGRRAVPESDIPHAPSVIRPRQSQPPSVTTRRQPSPLRVRGEDTWPDESVITTLPTRVRGAFDHVPSDVQGLSPEIETPESSNVYSVQYDYTSGLMYVRFNAASPVIGYKDMTSICSGQQYRCGIRPHAPGPLYSYGGAGRRIPENKFEEFVSAASKGQWVWENLRVCGSQWQHRFPYTLTDVPGGFQYIPRKATRRGLRVRTVPNIGQGRRGGRRSTLPESIR
ncbi:MAG: hypothetical protein CL480_11045 [Acidobacteria bacterium]|nr:hypothetical protein [Acidobacteriota bacterium]